MQVNLESGDELVIIEGVALPLEQPDVDDWADAYNQKYNWDMPAQADGVWQVFPTRVLAWISDSSGLDDGASFSAEDMAERFSRGVTACLDHSGAPS